MPSRRRYPKQAVSLSGLILRSSLPNFVIIAAKSVTVRYGVILHAAGETFP